MNARPLVAEGVGTAFLVAGVVGSGIMAERLSDDVGLQLLENAFATAGVLLALILALGPVSGAHFNPVVTIAAIIHGDLRRGDAPAYVAVQLVGGVLGAIAANLMFDLPAIEVASKERSGADLLFAEGIATAGLLLVIYGVVAAGRPTLAALTVSGYIGGAYWFTSSTSFANPAVTLGRMWSDTFAGIRPIDGVGFIVAQITVGVAAAYFVRWLFAEVSAGASALGDRGVEASELGT